MKHLGSHLSLFLIVISISLVALLIGVVIGFQVGSNRVLVVEPSTDTLVYLDEDMPLPLDEPYTKESCEALGGIWSRYGEFIQEQCSIPTSDAGKICNNSYECEGNCIATLTPQEESLLTQEFGEHILSKKGNCTAGTLDYYGCHPFVENGKVDKILCID